MHIIPVLLNETVLSNPNKPRLPFLKEDRDFYKYFNHLACPLKISNVIFFHSVESIFHILENFLEEWYHEKDISQEGKAMEGG